MRTRFHRPITTAVTITAGIIGTAIAYTTTTANAGTNVPPRPAWVRSDNTIDTSKAHHIPVYNPNGPPTEFVDLAAVPTDIPANKNSRTP